MATGQARLGRDVWHREFTWPANATGAQRVELRERDLRRRRALPGEQAVALFIGWLFEDATWYYETQGQFPDGLPPYDHETHYLELFRIVLAAVNAANTPKPAPASPPHTGA